MAVFPLLPRLSPDAPIAPVVSGDWEEAAGSNDLDRFLRGLAKGLDAPHSDKSIDSIDSIPDVWARPILFRMALFAANGFDPALHKKAQGEWRAILAMLALQDMRHLSLTAEAVHLNDIAVNGALGQTLMTLAPHDSADGNGQSSWKDVYVISFEGIPFAITSPTTLVATAADYSKALRGKLTEPWSNNGVTLTDPTKHLTADELSGLHLWLRELKDELQNSIDPTVQVTNQTCAQLFNAIDSYMDALDKHAQGRFVAAGTLISAGLKMHIGLFSHMDKMVQAPTVTITNGNNNTASAVKILTGAERSNAKPLLLLSPNMLRDLCTSRGISPAQLIVWPGITAADVKNESLGEDRTVIGRVPIGNAEWRRPEEFFTDRLTIHAGGEVLKGAIKVPGSNLLAKEDMSVILPLKPEILEYFTPEEIAQRFRIEKIGNDIKVQFEFALSGINGNPIGYQAEKIYPMQEVVYLVNNAPVIEIWPNFKKEGWKRYYLYYENSEAQNKGQNIGRDFFYVYPWGYGENIAGDTPDRGLSNLFTSRLSGFPDALICTVNMTIKGGVGAEPIEAGIILLNEPGVASEKMGQSWQIGIDFGTSSTMLYYRNGTNEPKPLDLQPNLFDVTDSGLLGLRTYRNFIPSSMENRQAGSFLSIFQLLNGTHLKGQIPNIRPLQDGNVFWLSTADGPDAEDFRSNSGQIDANLKWKGDQVGKLKVAAYIKQICLQSLAEAAKRGVGNISWNFSFPTAFSASQTMTFETTCKNAVNEGMKDSGMATGTMPVKPPEYWPESKACAYYFNKLGGVAFAGGAVCLDIGAGTTDISIISDRPARIVYHTSLQFAGRYLFQSIYKHYDLFAPGLKLDGMGQEQRNALIDADMRKNSDEYLYSLVHRTGDAGVEAALQIAQFAVAGIFYYLGGLLGLLHKKGIYKGNSVPDIYVGGNGSRIFPWICAGSFSEDNPYVSVLQDMLAETSGLPADFGFRIILSGTPKVEVARGMIEDKPVNHKEFFNSKQQAAELFGNDDGKDLIIANSVFAGDEFVLKGETREKTDFISAYDIAEGIGVTKVDELKAFAKAFNTNQYIWGQNIKITEKQYAGVAKAVEGTYAKQVGMDPNDIFVEPVFILALKGFMDMI